MKRAICLILLTVMLILSTACGVAPTAEATPPGEITVESPTPGLEEYPVEKVSISDLREYVIVYPSYYDEYRMGEVYILRDAIKNVTGYALDVISDGEEKREHEIIIASSTRENGIECSIEKFESGLDYAVGVRKGNIVLGGNNFYADMRAIYYFINNVLGYNDIDDIYSEPQSVMSGIEFNIYEKPLMTIMGSNFSVGPYTEQYAVRDMHDAHFNMMLIEESVYSREQILDFAKWCARYEIFIAIRSMKFTQAYIDCPIIWGHVIYDEPLPNLETYISVTEKCDSYIEEYGKYGWKPWVNFAGYDECFYDLNEYDGLFDTVPVMSFDRYFGHNIAHNEWGSLLHVYEQGKEIADRKGVDLWIYIEAYRLVYEKLNVSKLFRWSSYLSLCFGAKGILYFQYCDHSERYGSEKDLINGSLINHDFSKNEAWYEAQRTNEELLKLAEIYVQYETLGAYVMNSNRKQDSAYLEAPYPYVSDYISDFIDPDESNKETYLLSFFKKNDSNGKAFIIMNINDLDDVPYAETHAQPARVKINGENVKFYREGVLQSVPEDNDGYYLLEIGNGHCWFVEVE